MSGYDRFSRVNKFEKRRKNTKLMSMLIIAGGFLIILLIGLWIFGPDDDPTNSDTVTSPDIEEKDIKEEDKEEQSETEVESSEDDNTDDQDLDESDNNENASQSEIVTQPADPIGGDDNVVEAYTANWQPIGTAQEGPHTTNFDDGSQDRIEMTKALSLASGIAEDNMITWWVKRGGDQKVIGTVSDRAETVTYRVYISWIDNQGWQPTLVEVLKENDEKWRFE
ncbi:YrrS family protein [Ornithinibacillus scapharcae]|uniref:YrrS family protein n=1 Tax=Ornithinibacillus scapharcae TaxID=1147159 RepID=UPI000225BD77|nr:YrrS family protein [Ornithinibacillus scapharcae]